MTPFRYSSSRFVSLVVLVGGLGVCFCSSVCAGEIETLQELPGTDGEESPSDPVVDEPAESQKAIEHRAEEVALEAQRVHSEYCGSLQGADRALAGESFAVVGPAWSKVSGAYRETKVIYLLYWSGLLSECLGRKDDAVSDLEAFLADEDSRPLVSMLADAQWRLRRGTRGKSVTKRVPQKRRLRLSEGQVRGGGARFIPGIGLGAAAAVGGVVALFEWNHAGQFYIPDANKGESGVPRWELEADMVSATESANIAQSLGVISAGLALSSVVSFVVAAAVGPRAQGGVEKTTSESGTRFHVAPSADGVFLGLSRAW